MTAPQAAFLDVLRRPESAADAGPREWEALLALGRRHGVSGRWHSELRKLGLLARLPADVADQLEAEATVAGYKAVSVRWESRCIANALRGIEDRPLLLKGAAYMLAELPCGKARMVSDVDVLIPCSKLEIVENALIGGGWRSYTENPYDDAYYRRWMHELPPFQHVLRGTVVDVHHNILPRTSRLCPPPGTLFDRAVPVPGHPFRMLGPVDMLLHSIVHGFQDGEFQNGLRDTLDVHELATHFGGKQGFWDDFLSRVVELGFERPADYALGMARSLFRTDVPDAVTRRLTGGRSWFVVNRIVSWAFDRASVPSMPSASSERLAARILQVRAHWNKMPVSTLVGHLSHKLWQRSLFRLTRRKASEVAH